MRTSTRLGLLSIVSGALAVVLAVSATYANLTFDPANWFVFRWLESSGVMKSNPYRVAEVKEFTIFSINEENVILWVCGVAVVLAAVSLLATLAAELREEDNLFPSAGTTIAGMAMVVLDWRWGCVALFLSAALVLGIRRARQQPSQVAPFK